MHAGHALRDAAADVVPGEHDVGEAQFVDEAERRCWPGRWRCRSGGPPTACLSEPPKPRRSGTTTSAAPAEHRDDPAVVVAGAGRSRAAVRRAARRVSRIGRRPTETRRPGALRDRRSAPFWPYCQPDCCKVSESPVITAKTLRHASDGAQLMTSAWASHPAISRPSS